MNDITQTARDICEQLLASTGKALIEGDFESFSACFRFPQEMDTFAGRRMIENESEARQIFDALRRYYKKNGVTEMVRHCVEAEFVEANTIAATHETRFISGTIMTQAAFPVYSVLRRIDGTWKIAGGKYAIGDSDEHNAALMTSARPFPEQAPKS